MEIYVVRAGDSVRSVARRFEIKDKDLCYVNQLADPIRLTPGQSLVIPTLSEPERRSIELNACVYPNVSASILRETLPCCTYLSLFSCRADAEGKLYPPEEPDLTELARRHQTLPLLTVTNIGEDGGFSGEIAHSLLTREEVRGKLFEELTVLLRAGPYSGVNICFAYLYPFDRNAYSRFIAEAAERLHPLGRSVFTSVPPLEGEDRNSAYDYFELGRVSDRVILMTYEWGHTCSPPQAVSPVNRICRVLEKAVRAIPAEKLLMGFSNYAYDWTLPWQEGSRARLLSNAAAAELAVSRRSEIHYDAAAQAPWFSYVDAGNRRHTVWFEDARSAEARLRLAEEFSLSGISLWTADRPCGQLLQVLQSIYSVEKLL